MALAAVLLAAAVAVSPASYLESRQQPDGGFAEPGGRSTPGLTAWSLLGLRAAGRPAGRAYDYLVAHESELTAATDVDLAVLAEASTGRVSATLRARFVALVRSDGRIGPAINSTAWGVLADAQLGRTLRLASVRYLLRVQHRSGGWGWIAGARPDSNDTAAVIQALRVQGVGGSPIARGLSFMRRLRNRDGGFELTEGRGSDAQSTAWAIQAFVAARRDPGRAVFRYLARLRRPDGSYRYSTRYTATPVWVTSQVLPAILRKPFPLR